MFYISCDNFIALLHKFYAVNSLGREPHLVRSFGYRRESGGFYEAGLNLEVSRTLNQISVDGAQWQELMAEPLENVASNIEHCPFCEYNFFCNKYFHNQANKEVLP